MRHYEIVFMVNPDKEKKISELISYYKKFITKENGKIHRLENWGRRQLVYPINKLHKANYILMNIEVKQNVIKKLESSFRFNDSIIRNMIIRVSKAITVSSSMVKIKEDYKSQDKNKNKKTKKIDITV